MCFQVCDWFIVMCENGMWIRLFLFTHVLPLLLLFCGTFVPRNMLSKTENSFISIHFTSERLYVVRLISHFLFRMNSYRVKAKNEQWTHASYTTFVHLYSSRSMQWMNKWRGERHLWASRCDCELSDSVTVADEWMTFTDSNSSSHTSTTQSRRMCCVFRQFICVLVVRRNGDVIYLWILRFCIASIRMKFILLQLHCVCVWRQSKMWIRFGRLHRKSVLFSAIFIFTCVSYYLIATQMVDLMVNATRLYQ